MGRPMMTTTKRQQRRRRSARTRMSSLASSSSSRAAWFLKLRRLEDLAFLLRKVHTEFSSSSSLSSSLWKSLASSGVFSSSVRSSSRNGKSGGGELLMGKASLPPALSESLSLTLSAYETRLGPVFRALLSLGLTCGGMVFVFVWSCVVVLIWLCLFVYVMNECERPSAKEARTACDATGKRLDERFGCVRAVCRECCAELRCFVLVCCSERRWCG
mmetsp:Transcript_17112/g.48108  ORF Transcript_17112/g.48108 Transcript_17112/m.48108 type:complete len:216 (+) Transcript_17112:1096-1743(+)